MTVENGTNLETSLNEELALEDNYLSADDSQDAPEESESIEESLLNAVREVGGEAAEELKDEDIKRRDISASQAASILSKSKGGKRKIVDGKELQKAPTPAPKEAAPVNAQGQQEGPKHEPPARFTAAEKEWFNQQPAAVQRSVSDMLRGAEAQVRSNIQDVNRLKSKYSEIENIERTYMPSINAANPRLSFEAAQRELFATQSRLTNPQTSVAECARVLQSVGVSAQQVHDFVNGRGAAVPQQQQQQAPNSALTEDRVRLLLNQQLSEIQNQHVHQQAVSEIRQLRDQREQGGTKYLYPELHNDADIEALKPLDLAVRRATPGISNAEAAKKAIQLLRYSRGQISGSPAQTTARASNPNEMTKVRSAAVSVRPRANGAIPTRTGGKPGERMEDSILRSIAELEQ